MQEFTTVQEAMDYAVSKIVEQGGRCMGSDWCAYSDGKGNHCAIGWLMDEGAADIADNGKAVHNLPPELLPSIVVSNMEAFGFLQGLHDAEHTIDRLRNEQALARSYGIDTSSPHWQQWVDMGT